MKTSKIAMLSGILASTFFLAGCGAGEVSDKDMARGMIAMETVSDENQEPIGYEEYCEGIVPIYQNYSQVIAERAEFSVKEGSGEVSKEDIISNLVAQQNVVQGMEEFVSGHTVNNQKDLERIRGEFSKKSEETIHVFNDVKESENLDGLDAATFAWEEQAQPMVRGCISRG